MTVLYINNKNGEWLQVDFTLPIKGITDDNWLLPYGFWQMTFDKWWWKSVFDKLHCYGDRSVNWQVTIEYWLIKRSW